MRTQFSIAITAALCAALTMLVGCDITPEKPNLAGNPQSQDQETYAAATPKDAAKPDQDKASQPNILLIVADDLGYFDIGAFGSEIKTPNIDALARDGVRFLSLRAAPVCAPSRAMLMTGLDSHAAGVGAQFPRGPQVGKPGYEAYLKPSIATIAEVLKSAGYSTYMAGKWHLGMEKDQSAKARGFDRSFAMLLGGGSHFDKTGPGAGEAEIGSYREDGVLIDSLPEDFYSTRFYTDRLIDNIDNTQEGTPFFAYAAYTAPHWPLHAPDDYIDRYKGIYDVGYEAICKQRALKAETLGVLRPGNTITQCRSLEDKWSDLSADERKREARLMELYAAMVENLDANIGRLVEHLRNTGKLDNTFIFFMADNGAEARRHEAIPQNVKWIAETADNSYENLGRRGSFVAYGPNWASVGMSPYLDHKGTLSEGGIRVPAFAVYPGIQETDRWADQRLTVRDIAPTFAQLAGTQMPAPPVESDVQTRGRSFLPQLLDSSAAPRAYTAPYAWEFQGSKTIVEGDWKLLENVHPSSGSTGWMLFNLRNDPSETRDLSQQHPDILESLKTKYTAYAKAYAVVDLASP